MFRSKDLTSPLEDLTTGSFQRIIPDHVIAPKKTKRVLLCTGKVYFELARHRDEQKRDELLQEFLVETNESLDVVDVELVRFEQEPNNAKILANIFRIVHTIKGTCGFIGLPRRWRMRPKP